MGALVVFLVAGLGGVLVAYALGLGAFPPLPWLAGFFVGGTVMRAYAQTNHWVD